jgi:hypothetical protein
MHRSLADSLRFFNKVGRVAVALVIVDIDQTQNDALVHLTTVHVTRRIPAPKSMRTLTLDVDYHTQYFFKPRTHCISFVQVDKPDASTTTTMLALPKKRSTRCMHSRSVGGCSRNACRSSAKDVLFPHDTHAWLIRRRAEPTAHRSHLLLPIIFHHRCLFASARKYGRFYGMRCCAFRRPMLE